MRLLATFALIGVLGFVPTTFAQSAGAKTLKANGRVTAISAGSMTIRPGMETMTFVIDTDTKVKGKGVGTKTRELTTAKKPVTVTELVEEMDSVVVRYQDVAGKLLAREIDIKVKRRPL